jgi:hypothetical protein
MNELTKSEKNRSKEAEAAARRGGRREGGAQAQGAARHAGRLVRPGHDGADRLVGGGSDAARRGAGSLAGQRIRASHSWTLALLVAGLLGCLNAWHWVAKEDKAMRDEQEDGDE